MILSNTPPLAPDLGLRAAKGVPGADTPCLLAEEGLPAGLGERRAELGLPGRLNVGGDNPDIERGVCRLNAVPLRL